MYKSTFLSPSEIIDKYPVLEDKLNIGASEIGLFLKCKLLSGFYDRTKRVAMIEEQSVIELVDYINKKIEEQKIILNNKAKKI
ncbi:MAG: hypothetical protein Q7W13_07725 [Bacteroidia bacterium]|nr:hypothetical protein [Bacteroidia bacterium]